MYQMLILLIIYVNFNTYESCISAVCLDEYGYTSILISNIIIDINRDSFIFGISSLLAEPFLSFPYKYLSNHIQHYYTYFC